MIKVHPLSLERITGMTTYTTTQNVITAIQDDIHYLHNVMKPHTIDIGHLFTTEADILGGHIVNTGYSLSIAAILQFTKDLPHLKEQSNPLLIGSFNVPSIINSTPYRKYGSFRYMNTGGYVGFSDSLQCFLLKGKLFLTVGRDGNITVKKDEPFCFNIDLLLTEEL